MTTAAADILTRITTAAIKLGLGYLLAGRHRDAEQLAVQLEAMGPAQRADVDRVEAERIAELSGMLPPVGGRLAGSLPVDPELDPTIDARLREVDGDVPLEPITHRVGGPLEEGD